MPTLKEKLLTEINKNFGIVYVESLSTYEKSIYDKYHFQEKSPDELKEAAKEKYATAYRHQSRIGQYIEDLRQSDEYVASRCDEISNLQKNNLNMQEQIEAFKAEQKEREKQIETYQKKSDALNKKIEEIKAKAKKEKEEKEKAADEKEQKRITPLVQERANLKLNLSDIMIDDNRYQNYLSAVSNKKYTHEIVLKGLTPGTPEYKELEEEISEIDANIIKYTKELADIQGKLYIAQSEVDEIEQKINDQTVREKAQKEIDKAYEKAVSKADPTKNELLENEVKKEAINKEVNIIEKNISNLSNKIYENDKVCTTKDHECREYALNICKEERKEAEQEIKEIDQYVCINNAIESKEIKVTSVGKIAGLKNVKIAYQNYYNNHSAFGRFFKFLPFTSAHADYADFSEVREKYMEYSSVPRDEIDHYLDNKELKGSLLETSKTLDKDFVDNTLDKEAAMDKNTYKRVPGASVSDYLRACDDVYNKELNVLQKDMGYALVAADKGLKLLNELGNIKREKSSKEVNDMIDKVSKLTNSFGSMGKRATVIDSEITNALKPEAEREEITFEMPKNVEELYNGAKAEQEKAYNADENVVLFNNDATFTKITVNDVNDKEEDEEQEEIVEEKEVIDLTKVEDNFLDL